jgi:two-component system sensor histidine kinase UhpB
MALEPSPEDQVFLSTTPPGAGQRRAALIVVLTAAALFLVGLPFARIQLPIFWPFIPIYESWLVIIDSITAVLLFAQYAILRSRALLVLGCGYLFTATIMVAHALSFPGLFSPTGLMGAGEQTTAWLYAFWKDGFGLFVLAYALLKDEKRGPYAPFRRARVSIVIGVGIVVALTVSLTLLATVGERLLPVLMDGHRYARLLSDRPGWLDDRRDHASDPVAAVAFGA